MRGPGQVRRLSAEAAPWDAQFGRVRQLLKISDRAFSLTLTTLYVLVVGIVAFHHEPWRDELQAWLIARDSASLASLLDGLKYEGHPPLWYLLLMPLTRITHAPYAMAILHVSIAAAVVFLIARYAPFSRIQKTLLAFSYFLFYEYAVISRNYAPGVLLLFVLCILAPRRHSRFIPVALTLLLLGLTSIFTVIISITTASILFAEYWLKRGELRRDRELTEWPIWTGFAVLAVGVLLVVLQLKPSADHGWATGWFLDSDRSDVRATITTLSRAFLPIPKIRLNFWNSTFFASRTHLLLTPLLLIWVCIALVRKPVALLVFLTGAGGLMAFFHTRPWTGARHQGWFFMVFLAAVWIASSCRAVEYGGRWRRVWAFGQKSLSPLMTGILAIQVVGGVVAAGLDIRYEFSRARAAATLIRAHGFANHPMVGHPDWAASAVAGFLDHPIYYPRGERFGTFVVWDRARNPKVSDHEVLTSATGLARRTGQDVVIILNHELEAEPDDELRVRVLARFTGSIVRDEDFYLYILKGPSEGPVRG